MQSSEARVAANRRNSLKSTGPKTPEGKARSRANALKHGLCATVVVAEDSELFQQRAFDWYYTLKPQNEFHSWLVDQVVVISLRIDRPERIERRLRDRRSLRAELVWEDDRRLEAEILGGKLGSKPLEVVEELRRTPTGCDWLISRWGLLAHSARASEAWTENQARLASRMLGTPEEILEGARPGLVVDRDGEMVDQPGDLSAIAAREIAELFEHRGLVVDLDEVDQALAEADLLDESHPELKRLRRLESTLHRRLRWFLAQLKYEPPHRRPHPDLKPTWNVSPEAKSPGAEAGPVAVERPEQGPTDSIEPEVEIEPEPEQPKDPMVLRSRLERKIKKAEARREARRRRDERHRA